MSPIIKSIDELVKEYKEKNLSVDEITENLKEFDDNTISLILTSSLLLKDYRFTDKIKAAIYLNNKSKTLKREQKYL